MTFTEISLRFRERKIKQTVFYHVGLFLTIHCHSGQNCKMFNDQGIVFISHAIFYTRFLPLFATFLLFQVDTKVREVVKRKEEKENIS